MLGLPNNDKQFTHTQVGKIGIFFLTLNYIETFKISKAIYSFALFGLPNYANE